MKAVYWGGLAAAAAIAAGCASQHRPAPVVDGRSARPVTAAARPAVRAVAPVTPKSMADFYTVKRGDTLYSIAQEHGVEPRDVAQWNGLDDPTRLRVGQQLRVRPTLAVAAPPLAVMEPERSATAQVGSARILGRVDSRPLDSLPPLPPRAPAKPELTRMEVPSRVELEKSSVPAPAAYSQFIWPVKGKVLAEFAEPRRKGIDIDGKPGDPIVAAAPGHVTYIGSGIPGMGKLVVLKHDNGFITVYAHNRNILVKEKQAVARGQKIAELGSTDSERPKLHFQIRKGAAAVDPLLYLPK
ncbi:MAG TPA: peptidoglycan DD-metalloendopeptidase family protein [Burkholderiales bacterium]|nr:peptidoglycan DD-metalloendopeptidase family protein [Burkholderiales bacterium]